MRAPTIADAGVSATSRIVAIAIAGVLLCATLLALWFRDVPGPTLPAFIPICATVWYCFDLLTAFLLYAHYRVTGRTVFLVVACAYCITGLLGLPYLAAFPRVFFTGPSLEQVSISLWLIWHALFPIVIGGYFLADPELRGRSIDPLAIERAGWQVMTGVVVFCAAISAAIWLGHGGLPHFVDSGHFTTTYTRFAAPMVAVLSVVACVALFARTRQPTKLHVWLAVALFTTALDSILNAESSVRYGVSWYVGKLETLITATLLLGVLLQEIAILYEQISAFTAYDPLTGLRNRRSFDDAAAWMLSVCRRRDWPFAVMMIDIDHFKRFNDSFGHPAGDQCLKSVASALRAGLSRGSDLVARYGGEEFVVMLADVDAERATEVAERLRRAVSDGPGTTISIGLVWAACADREAGVDNFLVRADAALYEAKSSGRNRCVTALTA
jgi:diguanylate cyclase (GGDEF)-like protein